MSRRRCIENKALPSSNSRGRALTGPVDLLKIQKEVTDLQAMVKNIPTHITSCREQ